MAPPSPGILMPLDMGLPPMEALQVTTINGARLLKMDHLVGSLEKGKLADLVIVEGDPIKNIALLKEQSRIKAIILDGHFIKNELSTNP